jgi:hypothetical protein
VHGFKMRDFFGLSKLVFLKLSGDFKIVPPGIFDSKNLLRDSKSIGIDLQSTDMESLNPDAFSDLPGNGGRLNVLVKRVVSFNFAAMGFSEIYLGPDDNSGFKEIILESNAFATSREFYTIQIGNTSHVTLVNDQSFAGVFGHPQISIYSCDTSLFDINSLRALDGVPSFFALICPDQKPSISNARYALVQGAFPKLKCTLYGGFWVACNSQE